MHGINEEEEHEENRKKGINAKWERTGSISVTSLQQTQPALRAIFHHLFKHLQVCCAFFTRDEVKAQSLLKTMYISLKQSNHLNDTWLETPPKRRVCHLPTWFIDMTYSPACRSYPCLPLSAASFVVLGSWKEHILHLLKRFLGKTELNNFTFEVKILQLWV